MLFCQLKIRPIKHNKNTLGHKLKLKSTLKSFFFILPCDMFQTNLQYVIFKHFAEISLFVKILLLVK